MVGTDYFTFEGEMKTAWESGRAAREALLSAGAAHEKDALRAYAYRQEDGFRGAYSVDVDKILHNPFYNRLSDKTQVFSFYHNDDLTRRSLHVQLVARIATLICEHLNLNVDLARAIALGHDVGHTPFGHTGERYLNTLYHDGTEKHPGTGRYFNHNVHSVRALMNVTPANLTLQTYDGILCHNGEKDFDAEYGPGTLTDFAAFKEVLEKCYTEPDFGSHLRPGTLEGCVVRISDVIAYVAKDRQDAEKLGIRRATDYTTGKVFGEGMNSQVIGKVVKNIVKNSFGKPYIKLDKAVVDDLMAMKKENGSRIYAGENDGLEIVEAMMRKLYDKLLSDRKEENQQSILYTYHMKVYHDCYYHKGTEKLREGQYPEDAVVDFIASMTDDYLIDLFKKEFPEDPLCQQDLYRNYFDTQRTLAAYQENS